jgi:hypothetical protein
LRLLVAAPDHFTFAEPMQMSVLAAGIRDAGERRVARAAVARALRRFGLDAIRQAFRLCRRERAQGGPRSRTCSTRSCAAKLHTPTQERRAHRRAHQRALVRTTKQTSLGPAIDLKRGLRHFLGLISAPRAFPLPPWNWKGKAAVGGTKKSLSAIINCVDRAILLSLLPGQAGATYAVGRTVRFQ